MEQHWVVMTVGLNPLPCLVEAHRLCCIVKERTGRWPHFLVVRGRDYETRQIFQYLVRKLEAATKGQVVLNHEEVHLQGDAVYDPKTIFDEARNKIAARLASATTIHFPYTGGTKAMSLHVYEALRASVSGEVILSYLGRARHRLLSGSNQFPADLGDEREEWNLSLDELAHLHAFKRVSPKTVDPKVEVLASRMLTLMMQGGYDGYWNWLGKEWKRAFRGSNEKDVYIEKLRSWPTVEVPWYGSGLPAWSDFSEDLASVPAFGASRVWQQTNRGWNIRVDASLKDFLIPLYRFFDNQSLELYVYSKLRELLPEQYPVEHSIKFQETVSRKECEIDIAAVLGYQLIGMSCTLSKDYGQCKRKGFEILHRARQIGGDQALGTLVCLLDKRSALDLERELTDDAETAFRVFHQEMLSDVGGEERLLREAFRAYLKQTKWSQFAGV